MRNVTAFLICSKILNVLHQDVVTKRLGSYKMLLMVSLEKYALASE